MIYSPNEKSDRVKTRPLSLIRILLLSAAMGGSLAACGGGTETTPTTTQPPSPPPPPTRMAQTLAFTGFEATTSVAPQFLYLAQDDAQGQTKVSNATAPDNTTISAFKFSPDNMWIAYISRTPPSGNELFVQSVTGGAPVRVSQASSATRGVIDFDWAPSSMALTFSSTVEAPVSTQEASRVYLVGRDGSGLQSLTTGLPANQSYENPQYSPDGFYIIQEISRFVGNNVAANPFSLSFIDLTRALPNNTVLTAANGSVGNVRWSPNSTSLCFNLNNTTSDPNAHNIRISDVSIAAPNTFVVSDTGNFNSECRWSADGGTVAYLEDPISNSVSDLEIRDFDPAGSGSLGAPQTIVALAAQNRGIFAFDWSPADNNMLAYVANQDDPGTKELFVINVKGGAATKQNVMFPTSTADVLEFTWSPDGSRLAYIADAEANGVRQLFVVNADGSNHVEISDFLNSNEEVVSFNWSADSTRLAFSAGLDARTTDPDRLFVGTADGADTQLINTALVARIGAVAYSE